MFLSDTLQPSTNSKQAGIEFGNITRDPLLDLRDRAQPRRAVLPVTQARGIRLHLDECSIRPLNPSPPPRSYLDHELTIAWGWREPPKLTFRGYSSILIEPCTNTRGILAKARLTTKSGTSITIEGSAAEVAELVKQIEPETGASKPQSSTGARSRRRREQPKATPINLISSLIDGGFFRKKPKDLAAVKGALAEMGHVYPVTTLSPTLLRLVRSRQLRRLKEKKRWLYTG